MAKEKSFPEVLEVTIKMQNQFIGAKQEYTWGQVNDRLPLKKERVRALINQRATVVLHLHQSLPIICQPSMHYAPARRTQTASQLEPIQFIRRTLIPWQGVP